MSIMTKARVHGNDVVDVVDVVHLTRFSCSTVYGGSSSGTKEGGGS